MSWHVAALAFGFCLDALLGDPYRMPHVIRAVGGLISVTERALRRTFPATAVAERAAGVVLVLVVVGVSCGAVAAALWLASLVSRWLWLAVATVLCYQLLAAKQLRVEATRVWRALEDGDVEGARRAVSMIVGRDTQALDAAGIIRATVETVAENTSDGVVAPLLFLGAGGPVGGMLYKAVNTMDSMVGYKNEAYRHFGTAAARMDDVLNWVPARLTGVLMCLAAVPLGLDGRGAWRVFLRDRLRHASPNSAHPEAACAGALGVRLAGPASYFGVTHDKPTIGDDLRPVVPADILWANRLSAATSVAALALSVALAVLVGPMWEAVAHGAL